MKDIKGCLSHRSDDWKTPTPIYNEFIKNKFIDTFTYQSEEDELRNTYYGAKLFINPPFSKLNEITEWIITQINNKNLVALLIPVRTDTRYFKKLSKLNPVIIFIEGRLHYNDSKAAPFPTMLILYNSSLACKCGKVWTVLSQTELINIIKHL